jgi:hypothetical protein
LVVRRPANALGCHISDMILTPMRDLECALLCESPAPGRRNTRCGAEWGASSRV